MERASLIRAIDNLLVTQIWDRQEVFSLLQQVQAYLASLDQQVETINKLTDLVDLPEQQDWSGLLDCSNNQANFYLLEKTLKSFYPLTISGNWEDEIFTNPENLSSSTLTPNELNKTLNSLEKLIICCPTGQYESLSLEVEKNAKFNQINWLNPAFGLILSELEQLNPGPTLAIWTGEATTEFAYIDLPIEKNTISYNLGQIGSIQYGHESLLQDLFCYLIYPQWQDQLNNITAPIKLNPARAGHADSHNRNILKEQLAEHPLGPSLLKFTILLEEILQLQQDYSSQLRKKPWQVNCSQYYSQIVDPYLEYLQVSIESILKIRLSDVQQVVYRGKLIESVQSQAYKIFTQAALHNAKELEIGFARTLECPVLFA